MPYQKTLIYKNHELPPKASIIKIVGKLVFLIWIEILRIVMLKL